MNPPGQSIRLFQFQGINVYLHWSWFLIAIYEIESRQSAYTSPVWNVLEYLSIFLIVLLHEFGHALACRQVGGQVHQIMLWPLGGVASVSPPQRPGAMLWSIVAGPLVNVFLIPVLYAITLAGNTWHLWGASPGEHEFLHALTIANIILLVFNLLPVYPLDGGKILWSVLWFAIGRAKSLMIAVICGFIGIAGFAVLAFSIHSTSIIVMGLFLALSCWSGLKSAWALVRLEKMPRHAEYSCPSCHARPPQSKFWRCTKCKNVFDPFEHQAICPICGLQSQALICLECHTASLTELWLHSKVDPSIESENETVSLETIMKPLHLAKTWLRLVAVLTIAAGIITALTVVGIVVAWIPIWAGIALYQATSGIDHPQFYDSRNDHLSRSLSKLALYFKVQAFSFVIPVVLVPLLIVSLLFVPRLLRSAQPTNESAAIAEIRAMIVAENKYILTAGKFGGMTDLQRTGLISAAQLLRHPGYRIRIESEVGNYIVLATATGADTGRYDYYSFADGIIRYAGDPARAPSGESAQAVK